MSRSQESSTLQESQIPRETRHNHEDWISIPAVAKIMGMSDFPTRKLIARGHVKTRRLPGCQLKVYRPDVEALIEKSTTPGSFSR